MLTPELEKRYMNIGGGNTRIGEFLQYQLAINILEASDTDRQVSRAPHYTLVTALVTTFATTLAIPRSPHYARHCLATLLSLRLSLLLLTYDPPPPALAATPSE